MTKIALLYLRPHVDPAVAVYNHLDGRGVEVQLVELGETFAPHKINERVHEDATPIFVIATGGDRQDLDNLGSIFTPNRMRHTGFILGVGDGMSQTALMDQGVPRSFLALVSPQNQIYGGTAAVAVKLQQQLNLSPSVSELEKKTLDLAEQLKTSEARIQSLERAPHSTPAGSPRRPYWMIAALAAVVVLGIVALFFPGETVKPGTIVAFAGTTVPDGWLLCDGAEVDPDDYGDLARAIGTAWGEGAELAGGGRKIKLPDLRGMFLRGAEPTGDIDPFPRYRVGTKLPENDAVHVEVLFGTSRLLDSRVVQPQWRGRGVGTLQGDAVQAISYVTNGVPSYSYAKKEGEPKALAPRVENETRPKNAAVNWIIKY